MIATGTDVKPIECLIFMRDVRSKNYFEQMKGRGTRTLGHPRMGCDDVRVKGVQQSLGGLTGGGPGDLLKLLPLRGCHLGIQAIETFREFIQENRDEITALRIIYDQRYKDRPMAIAKLKALYEKLKARNITVDRLWDCYAIKQPNKVKRGTVVQLAVPGRPCGQRG